MSAAFSVDLIPAPRTAPDDHHELTLLEVEESEQELNRLVAREYRMHEANIQHDPKTCLVCFGARMVEAD